MNTATQKGHTMELKKAQKTLGYIYATTSPESAALWFGHYRAKGEAVKLRADDNGLWLVVLIS